MLRQCSTHSIPNGVGYCMLAESRCFKTLMFLNLAMSLAPRPRQVTALGHPQWTCQRVQALVIQMASFGLAGIVSKIFAATDPRFH